VVTEQVPISEIETHDVSTQPRAQMEDAVILRYSEVWQNAEAGAYPFREPVVLFCDGGRYWIGDGWYRVLSGIRTGQQFISADVRNGGKEDALLYATSCNHQHGQPSTLRDRLRAVRMTLTLKPEWGDGQIASHCHVAKDTVAKIREKLVSEGEPVSNPRSVGFTARNGKVTPKHVPDAQVSLPYEKVDELGKAAGAAARIDEELEAHFMSIARLLDQRAETLKQYGKKHGEYRTLVRGHLSNAFNMFLEWRRA